MEKQDCPLIQTYQLLINEIPAELQNLEYGIYPDNTDYNNVRFIYNKLFNYFPHAIFYPHTEKEISYLIKNFVKYDLEFSIRCGGHAYEPASLSEGYIISLENLSKIKIDKKNMTVYVGSGVKLGNLISKLSEHNLITTTGDHSCVGVSGLSLAGGKGYLTRLYGMVCDNIVSVRIVNHQGKIIKANSKINPDLFWAVKGSGICNYGVITEIELAINNDIYCQIASLTWKFIPSEINKILELYQKTITVLPNEITTDINLSNNAGNISFTIKFIKFSKKKFIEIDDFKNLHNPDISYCKGYYSQITSCWVDYPKGFAPCFSKIKSTMVFKPIVSTGLGILVNSIENANKLNAAYYQINFTQVGGKVEEGDSSYFPKKAIYIITILIQWNNQNNSKESIDFINNVYKNIVPFTSKFCFPNMIDYDIVNYMNAYYGTNADKLITIKKKYDPQNIFNWKQSIPVN